MESEKAGVWADGLAAPLLVDGKPVTRQEMSYKT